MKGPWTPAGTLPESFKKLPADDELEGRQSEPSRARRSAPARCRKVFVELQPAELILLQGRARRTCRSPAPAVCCGSATPRATSSGWAAPAPSTSSSPAAGSRRRTSPVRGRSRRRRCPPTSRRFRSSTSDRACSRRCRARRRRPRPCCSRRSRRRRPSSKDLQGAGGRLSGGTPQFQPIEKTTRPARRQHRQGHLQGRRPVLHVLPGRLVHVEGADRPVGGHRRRAEGDLRDPGELAVAHRDLRHGPGVDDRRPWSSRPRRPTPAMMVAWGCAVWGTGYYYPPYVYHGGYPDLLPALSDLRIRRLRTTRGPAPTRAAPWPTARTAARASRSATTRAPARTRAARSAYGPYGARGAAQAYNPRTGAYGATRQGSNVYGSWGTTGVARGDHWATHLAVHEQRHGQDDARHPDGSGGGEAVSRAGPAAATASPRPAAATSTPATTATSTGRRATAGRSTATAAGAASISRRRLHKARGPADRCTGRADGRGPPRFERLGFVDGTTGDTRLGRARRRRPADARRERRAQRGVVERRAATGRAAASARGGRQAGGGGVSGR